VTVIPVTLNGTQIYVESVIHGGSQEMGRLSDAQEKVMDAAKDLNKTIVSLATASVNAIMQPKGAIPMPEAFEIEFGLKFSAEGKVFVAGASADASLLIKLKYSTGKDARNSGK
jgi:hypothetical protein